MYYRFYIIDGEIDMSIKNPGLLHDATPSWNGYTHQGKIALWYTICELTNRVDKTLSDSENKQRLSHYFLELEYLEDFSFGEIVDEKLHYLSVHQVKSHAQANINHYESALLGLAAHLLDYPSISAAYLHVTCPLKLTGTDFLSPLQQMIKNPSHLSTQEDEIIKNRMDPSYRTTLTTSKKGRPSNMKSALIQALHKAKPEETKLTDDNLDIAFDALLLELKNERHRISSLDPNNLNKIQLFSYSIQGVTQSYCEVLQAEGLLKNALCAFYSKYNPTSYKKSPHFINNCYLFLLGKLDQHITERALNFSAYKNGTQKRQILLSQIFEWLLSDEIDAHDEQFYLYHVKETIFKSAAEYCSYCDPKKSGFCTNCQVPVCLDHIGNLRFEELDSFLRLLNPHITGSLSMDTFPKFADSHGIQNPLLKGIRDIPSTLLQNDNSLTFAYQNREQLQCALTMILGGGTDHDDAIVCSQILRNNYVYDLLMDYDCLISKDVEVPSIQDHDLNVSTVCDKRQSDHIVHCKDVNIIPLQTFIDKKL